MMKMNQPKLGPTMAQTIMQKNLYFLRFFNIVAHILAPAALHMTSALSAPLAKMCKNN